jgi:hypothetical protein
MGNNQTFMTSSPIFFCMLIYRIPRALKGLSYEIDFENVNENLQIRGTSDF